MDSKACYAACQKNTAYEKMSSTNWTDDKLISRLLNNKTDKSYGQNIIELRKRPSQELFAKCEELTQSDNPKVRKIGIDILAQLGLPPRPFLKQTLKRYFDLLSTETDPEVLMFILFSIGHNNDKLTKKQIAIICSYYNYENKMVKEGLVSALGFIDDLRVIEVLINLTKDKSNDIRNWATFYIGRGERNNKNIREALWQRINDKHQDTRLEAISGLAKRKDKRVIEIIRKEIINGEYGTLLFEAILETQEIDFLPLLKQNLKMIKDDKTINPEWVRDLKNCISELTRLRNKKRTTA